MYDNEINNTVTVFYHIVNLSQQWILLCQFNAAWGDSLLSEAIEKGAFLRKCLHSHTTLNSYASNIQRWK